MLSNIIWWIFLQKRGGDPKIPQKRLRQFFCKWGGGVPKKRYFWSKNTIFNPISSLFRPFWSILRVLGPFLALCNTQMSQNGRISLGTPDLFILYIFLYYLLPCFPSCCRIRLSTVQPIILPLSYLFSCSLESTSFVQCLVFVDALLTLVGFLFYLFIQHKTNQDFLHNFAMFWESGKLTVRF